MGSILSPNQQILIVNYITRRPAIKRILIRRKENMSTDTSQKWNQHFLFIIKKWLQLHLVLHMHFGFLFTKGSIYDIPETICFAILPEDIRKEAMTIIEPR